MKSLYIIALFTLSINAYAQDSKQKTELQEAVYLKESKEFEAKMMKEAEARSAEKRSTTLASEQGLEVKNKSSQTQSEVNNSGKLLPNTVSLQEVLASIPGRQPRRNSVTSNVKPNVAGIPNTATLEEIKKTIPKN
ncbi:hypothetical protein [Chryseobacterium sp. RLHN22]|uniref:hypothetical protein n=1 Tax=Chryseobacterium sp. RLHN22 TaxID=3437885 RepID=UPI003D9BA4D7